MNQSKEQHRLRNRIILALIILALIGCFGFLRWNTRVHFYKDEGTTGNTSTNLLNGGLFAKSGDTIYFANPYDQNSLYSMDTGLKHVKKVYNDYTSYINAAGDYVFYTRRNDKKGTDSKALFSFSTTGLYRINTNGQGLKQLYNDPSQSLNLLGNHIYYQRYDQKEGLQLFRIGIDGKKDTMLLKEGAAPVIANNIIYYTGVDSDHNIHKLSVSGGSPSVVYEGNFTGLSYVNGALYCMDMDNDYTLCRLDLSTQEMTHLTQVRIATYNVSSDGATVYYQVDNGKDNGLYVLDTKSGVQTELRSGNYNYYHIIDNYLFFEEFDGSAAYVMNLSNEQIEDFHPKKGK
ncbi:DUF5050 domain-containing protein [Ruminococcus callidus]|uniref:DUF5050 domain-containing protein n=1 Tax=Ruminococcus callidus TaxID=40519 RepID=UPI0026EE995B|nr:DUF5050 domain-containing protein [Ruminococcus callidus]MBS4829992.1 DUF5050 domain-containing protein [Ruminococcus callidus]